MNAETRRSAAHEALLDYQQADEEGIVVLVSRQAIHEVSEQLDASDSAPAWQDISTAPKDGTSFDAWLKHSDGGCRHTDCFFAWGVLSYLHDEIGVTPVETLSIIATHWMPLPEPPTAQTEGE